MKSAWFSGHLGRRSEQRVLHPGEWAATPPGKPRVLIENGDRADLWAHAGILRDAGYEVAVCQGPSIPTERASWFDRRRGSGASDPQPFDRMVCPLVVAGRCSLVDGADVVVSTTDLTEGREVLSALSVQPLLGLVVEGTTSALERDADVIGSATPIALPVTEQRLLAAVESALASRAEA